MSFNIYRSCIALSCIALSTLLAHAQEPACTASDASTRCSEQVREEKFERADGEVQATVRRLLRNMSGPKRDYVDYPKLRSRFVKAQDQWKRFRDQECQAWYVFNEAGTGRNADELDCLIARTKERRRQLDQWLRQSL